MSENATNHEPRDSNHEPRATSHEDDEIGFLDLLIVLAKHKKLVLGLPLVAAVIAAVGSLLATPVYTGVVRLFPPQQSQSSAMALLGQLGGLGSVGASAFGIKSPSEIYIAMLKSRTVADNLVQRFKLQELYKAKFVEDARMRLAHLSKIVSGRDGVITIEVEDEDRKRAAMMANAYVEELDKLTHTLAVTEASQRRLFFEKQLKLAKNSLADAEVTLKKMQEETGLIKLDEQGRAIIEAVATLRAQVAAKEVQIGVMRTFATEHNPELVRTQGELAGLRAQLSKLEKNNVSGGGDIYIPTGKIPETGLEYIRRVRDVKYHETMFELMAKQYEIARVDEAKDAAIIQVLDPAIEPERRTRPKRTSTVIVVALIAGVLAVVFAFIMEARERVRKNPQQAARLALLRRYVRGK